MKMQLPMYLMAASIALLVAGIAPNCRGVVATGLPSPVVLATPDPLTCPPPDDLDDTRFYRADLRPEFVEDLERLPSATRYYITVRLEPGNPPVLVGSQRVRYTNTETEALERVVFRLYPNLPYYGGVSQVDHVLVDGQPVQPSLTHRWTALEAPLVSPLAPGGAVQISMDFRVEVPTDNTAGYGQFAYVDGVYSLPGFYPTIPVFDDEGWNVEISAAHGDVTFTDAALYRVCFTAPADLTLIASGVTVGYLEPESGVRTWVLEAGPVRDFAVFLSRDFQTVSQEVAGTSIKSIYYSADEDSGRRALQYAVDAFEIYSRLFGPYPYTELDMVATPNNAGGIEYPGVVVINQALYPQERLQAVIAHEVAHQWWYGLVGSDQLDEPWMDEALANYSTYLYYQARYGDGIAAVVREEAFVRPYQQAVFDGGERAVAGRVSSFDAEDYYAFVYAKGPLFFDALSAEMGSEAFLGALQAYLAAHRYGVVGSEDLLIALEARGGSVVTSLYEQWILNKENH